jgi:hypothetical protein
MTNMLRSIAFAALASLALGAVACSAHVGANDANDTSADELRSQKLPSPVGSWDEQVNDALVPFYAIDLKKNGTFQWTGGCRPDATSHCMAISRATGTWTTKKSGPELGAPGGAPELVLTDEFNQVTTYFYSVSPGREGQELCLSIVYNGQLSVFTKHVN